MELKIFQVMLNSGESLMEESQGIIVDGKKESDRIWESSCAIIAEGGMPRIEKSEIIAPGDSRIQMMENEH